MKILEIHVRTTFYEQPMMFPPLGLGYLKTILVGLGHKVDFIDMSEFTIDESGRHMDKFPDTKSIPLDYDLYLINGCSAQAKEIRSVGRFLKEKEKPAIVGGVHVTNYAGPETPKGSLPFDVKTDLVDGELISNYPVMVKNEGEFAVLEAIRRMEEGMTCLRQFGRGIVIKGQIIEDLGTVPIPDRSNALMYKSFIEDKSGHQYHCTHMFTSRGCPWRCAFCDSPGLWTRKVRFVPINRVVEELVQIQNLGLGAIQFYDDALPLNKERMTEICRYLKKMGFLWRCFMRADLACRFGKGFLQMMHDSGMVQILVGVESGSQEILNNIFKDTSVEQNSQICQWCKEIGIIFKAAVILGLPGESMVTMEATRRWVLENRPDRCGVSIYVPFRGTPITDQGKRHRYGMDGHSFDIKIEVEPGKADELYYYGSRTKLSSVVSTSKLTAAEIHDFFLRFSAELVAEGISY